MVNNVYVSAVTQDNISRFELLQWVNECLQASIGKIEEMSTGAAYCQMTDLCFPGRIGLKKVKWNSRNDIDWINNWKILQTAWKDIGIDKPVPVERLLKGKFQDNFEFLQWFKKLFDANYVGEVEYDPVGARGGEGLGSAVSKPGVRRAAPAAAAARPAPTRTAAPTAAAAPVRRAPAAATRAVPAARVAPAAAGAAPTPAAAAGGSSAADKKKIAELEATIADLDSKCDQYAESLQQVESERDFYFDKLRRVEVMCTEAQDGGAPVDIDAILAVLYETTEEESAELAANGVSAAVEPEEEEEDLLADVPAPVAAPAAAAPAPAAPAAVDDDDETF